MKSGNGKKIIYYKDKLNDDFAPSRDKINVKKLPPDYRYEHKNPIWIVLQFIIYRIIATPFVMIYCKIVYGLRVRNKKVLKKIKSGYFLYVNHTNGMLDAYIPTIVSFPRRSFIVTADDAVSIPGIRYLVGMLGALPLPDTIGGTRKSMNKIEKSIHRHNNIMIYPEAHIWPYYNDIRPFGDSSFVYPVKLGVPAVPVTVVYSKHWLFGEHRKPRVTVVIGDPILPDSSVPTREARRKLRDEVYSAMKQAVYDNNSYEYIKYLPEDDATTGDSRATV